MNRRPIVVLQSGDAFENRTRVLTVAIACREHGWAPVVLVDDIGAASAFALNDIACVAFADLPDRGDPGRSFEPDDLCALHLLKCAVAGRRMDEDDWSEVIGGASRLWRMLDALAPKALFVWNGYTGVWANALRLYKSDHRLPGGFMERGPIAGGAFVDERGVNGHASLAFDIERAPGADAGITLGVAPDMSGVAVTAGRSADKDQVLFVPLQVHDDSNVLLHSPRMARMRDLVNFAIRLRERLGDSWRVVARPHPEERPGARLNLPADPRLTIDAETSLETHLGRSAVCLTINSMVGLQAALAGCVTVCFGEGVYCRRSFVVAGQSCDFKAILDQVEQRLARGAGDDDAARDFMTELAERSLFWPGQNGTLAAAKLTRFGLKAAPNEAAGPAGREGVRVERPGDAYHKMLLVLAALKRTDDEIVADFDFDLGERLFVSYRRNREPLTRAHLEARAGDLLGRTVRLSKTHRALGGEGRVLMTHSRRLPQDIDRYDLVLDEFGLPHARVYLETAGSCEAALGSDAA